MFYFFAFQSQSWFFRSSSFYAGFSFFLIIHEDCVPPDIHRQYWKYIMLHVYYRFSVSLVNIETQPNNSVFFGSMCITTLWHKIKLKMWANLLDVDQWNYKYSSKFIHSSYMIHNQIPYHNYVNNYALLEYELN